MAKKPFTLGNIFFSNQKCLFGFALLSRVALSWANASTGQTTFFCKLNWRSRWHARNLCQPNQNGMGMTQGILKNPDDAGDGKCFTRDNSLTYYDNYTRFMSELTFGLWFFMRDYVMRKKRVFRCFVCLFVFDVES